MSVRYLPSGDTALVIELGDRVDRAVSNRVLALHRYLRECPLDGVVETVPTFRSLMVHYDPLRTSAAALERALAEVLGAPLPDDDTGSRWRIPACYDAGLAPDLEDVAERTGLTAAEVVGAHLSVAYHVYMVGFLPGFPYLGDLPEVLALPRRKDPRVRVPPGSVAIANAMSAIYPLESPGGWHLIGNTPVPMFDLARSPPSLCAPGDTVEFERVSAAEHEAIARTVARGDFDAEGCRVR